MDSLTIRAYAKINLHLHLTGRKENGYHMLDSLVAFTDLADVITLRKNQEFNLSIAGETDLLHDCPVEENLVTRAARQLALKLDLSLNVAIHLTKNIPTGAGLGGGSADAAATLKGLCHFWDCPDAIPIATDIAAQLGSDIVACMEDQSVIMRDVGNSLQSAPTFPVLHGILVKPNSPCPTPLVYQTYRSLHSGFSVPVNFPTHFHSTQNLCDFLKLSTHNDLTEATIAVNPEVANVLDSLSTCQGVLLSRLSGSGSTCFAIFKDHQTAMKSAETLTAKHPEWWIKQVTMNAPQHRLP